LLSYFVYFALIILINGESAIGTIDPLLILFEKIPVCILFASVFERRNYSIDDVLRIVVLAGLIEAVLCIIALLNEHVKEEYLQLYISSGYDKGLNVYRELATFRLFALASSPNFITPVILATSSIFSFYLCIRGRPFYILSGYILLFAAIINARISFVVFFVGMFLLFLLGGIARKKVLKLVLIIVCGIAIFSFLMQIYAMHNISSLNWILTGIDEIFSFMTGQKLANSTFNYLFDEAHYRLPEDLGVFFGRGTRILLGSNKYNVASDIGYINDIWLGGILGSVLAYCIPLLIILSIRNIGKGAGRGDYFVAIFLTLILYLINIKGLAFSSNEFISLYLLVIVYFLSESSKSYAISKI